VDVLPYLQGESNNVAHATTGYASNKLAYRFRIDNTLDMLTELVPEDFGRLRQLKREDAESAMAFASALSKARYDLTHQAIINQCREQGLSAIASRIHHTGVVQP